MNVEWKPRLKGPGRALHAFVDDAAGERVELLAYDCPANQSGPRTFGFEIYGRTYDRGPFHDQLARVETDSLEEAMHAATEMAAKPRNAWVRAFRSKPNAGPRDRIGQPPPNPDGLR